MSKRRKQGKERFTPEVTAFSQSLGSIAASPLVKLCMHIYLTADNSRSREFFVRFLADEERNAAEQHLAEWERERPEELARLLEQVREHRTRVE